MELDGIVSPSLLAMRDATLDRYIPSCGSLDRDLERVSVSRSTTFRNLGSRPAQGFLQRIDHSTPDPGPTIHR